MISISTFGEKMLTAKAPTEIKVPIMVIRRHVYLSNRMLTTGPEKRQLGKLNVVESLEETSKSKDHSNNKSTF